MTTTLKASNANLQKIIDGALKLSFNSYKKEDICSFINEQISKLEEEKNILFEIEKEYNNFLTQKQFFYKNKSIILKLVNIKRIVKMIFYQEF